MPRPGLPWPARRIIWPSRTFGNGDLQLLVLVGGDALFVEYGGTQMQRAHGAAIAVLQIQLYAGMLVLAAHIGGAACTLLALMASRPGGLAEHLREEVAEIGVAAGIALAAEVKVLLVPVGVGESLRRPGL